MCLLCAKIYYLPLKYVKIYIIAKSSYLYIILNNQAKKLNEKNSFLRSADTPSHYNYLNVVFSKACLHYI